jgi:hypothetical protein
MYTKKSDHLGDICINEEIWCEYMDWSHTVHMTGSDEHFSKTSVNIY